MCLDLSKPVQTRDGRKARILCTDFKSKTFRPMIVLIESPGGTEGIYFYFLNGTIHDSYDPSYQLINVPEKKTLYYVTFICKNNPAEIFGRVYLSNENRNAGIASYQWTHNVLDIRECEIVTP